MVITGVRSPLVSVSASQENAVDSPKEPSFLLVHTTPEKSVPEGEEVFSVPVESTERLGNPHLKFQWKQPNFKIFVLS